MVRLSPSSRVEFALYRLISPPQPLGLSARSLSAKPSAAEELGRRLLAFALEWFRAEQITPVELQAVAGNPNGIRFYQQLGWHEELLQMVWDTAQHQP